MKRTLSLLGNVLTIANVLPTQLSHENFCRFLKAGREQSSNIVQPNHVTLGRAFSSGITAELGKLYIVFSQTIVRKL